MSSARSIPTIAFSGGSSCRSRASRALRLRSPRDKPLRSLMDVLLDALGYQARQPHQEDAFASSTDAHKELLVGAGGEAEVGVGVTADVEPVRIWEGAGVVVGGSQE